MFEEIILVRYGEIALKSNYVRRKFENILITNIRKSLKKEEINFSINKERGRIYIKTSDVSKSLDVLKHVFGIVSFSLCYKTSVDFNEISKIAVLIAKNKIDDCKSFAIRSKRTGSHDFTSQNISEEIGRSVIEYTNLQVDLTNPDIEIFIEVRDQICYVYSQKIKGTGGLPYGTQGKIIAIINNPWTILASWYMMKRGCKTYFVLSDKKYVDVLKDFIKKWYVDSDFILINSDESYFERINDLSEKKGAESIVTGHNITEKLDENLKQIYDYKKNLDLPVLHPIISMEKKEIIEKSNDLGIKI